MDVDGTELDVTIVENQPSKKRRGRSNSLSLASDSSDMLLKALQAMETRLSDKIETFANDLNNKIDNVKAEINIQIVNLSLSFDNKLKEKVSADEFSKLQQDISLLRNNQKDMQLKLDKCERENLLNRLVITGIPNMPEENLKDICGIISLSIGCSLVPNSAYRLKENPDQIQAADSSIKARKLRSSAIVIKFNSNEERFVFFQYYLKFKVLNLTHIGFKTPARIYINELLTPHNSKILRAVRELKNNGKIKGYYSSRGIVYITSMKDNVLKKTAIRDCSDISSMEN